MTAAETLRDAIQQKATAIAAKSSSVAVDQMAADIVVLAAQIPLLPPTVVSVANPDGTAIESALVAAEADMNRAVTAIRNSVRLSGTSVGTTPFPIAAKLAMSVQPSGAVNDVAFTTQPAVVVTDTGGVTVPIAGTTVTAALASGTGTLGGTLTADTASTGIATFTDLKITGLVGNFTIVFTATSLSSITSGTVTTTAGAATKLSVTTQPAGAVSGVALTTQPVVRFEDLSSNPTGTGTANVVAAIASGSGSLSGTTTKAAVAGVATFTDLVITGTGAHTLTFTSTGLTAATSSGFTATTPGSFAAASLGTKTYETGLWTTAPKWHNGSVSGNPTFDGTWGHQIVTGNADTGVYSRSYSYAPNPGVEKDKDCIALYGATAGGPINSPQFYWRVRLKFTGTMPTSPFKFLRVRGADPNADMGGVYINGGNICWAHPQSSNVAHPLGLWKGAQPAGCTSVGYTAYATNLNGEDVWHTFLMHFSNTGGTYPRARFWWDGAPIVQAPTQMRDTGGTTNYNAYGSWSAGSGSDPDYGASAPSWINGVARSNSANLYNIDSCQTLNANNTGTGVIYFDNEAWSITALDPAG